MKRHLIKKKLNHLEINQNSVSVTWNPKSMIVFFILKGIIKIDLVKVELMHVIVQI